MPPRKTETAQKRIFIGFIYINILVCSNIHERTAIYLCRVNAHNMNVPVPEPELIQFFKMSKNVSAHNVLLCTFSKI